MKVTLWGTRGSLASPGPDTTRYGGNTSCVEVRGDDGSVLVLDAGTGIRRLGAMLPRSLRRIDLLLTHLHMDHIQGLAFFAPLRRSGVEVHIWGPASATQPLRARLMRYLSPPLFPVHLRDLACDLFLHEVPCGDFEAGEFRISSAFVCHPDPTVGYRIATPRAPAQSGRGQAPAQSGRPPAYAEGRWQATLAYLPDHEPALGARKFPLSRDWTSGYALAAGVDLLIHDAQYTQEEYAERIGFGHSSLSQAFEFAALAEVKHFVPFHHDPAHTDDDLDRLMDETMASARPRFAVTPGTEGATFVLN